MLPHYQSKNINAQNIVIGDIMALNLYSNYHNPFAGSGAFKFHPYSNRRFKEYKSKMQAVHIHLFTSVQIIIHDIFFKNILGCMSQMILHFSVPVL